MLHYAARYTNMALIQTLVSRGMDVKARDHRGETPLHAACENGDPRIVKILLERGADPMVASTDGRTPLHVACQFSLGASCPALAIQNTTFSSRSAPGPHTTPSACDAGHTTIVKLLLEHGAARQSVLLMDQPHSRQHTRATPSWLRCY